MALTFCGHPGKVSRTSFTLAKLSSDSGPERSASKTGKPVYRFLRVGATLARPKGAPSLPPGYSYVNSQTWTRRF